MLIRNFFALTLLAQLLFYAFKIANGAVFPDELEHFERCQYYFREFTLFIHDLPSTYRYGPISTSPFFYHFLMGNLQHLQPYLAPGLHNMIFLRLANVILGMLTYYFSYCTICELTKDRLIKFTTLLILTNTMMYVSLFAAVSYDNLTNCLAVISFYHLIKIANAPLSDFQLFRKHLLYFILISLMGCLTKITYLPLLLIQIPILFYYGKKFFHPQLWQQIPRQNYLLLMAIVLFLSLNGGVYLRNLLLYHTPVPSCQKVLGEEICSTTAGMVKRDAHLKQENASEPLLPFQRYFKNYIEHTLGSTFALHGHMTMIKDTNALQKEFMLIAFALALLLLFNSKHCFSNPSFNLLFISALAYASIVLYTNYQSYIEIRSIGHAIQGRYNFPVLLNLVLILVYGSMHGLASKIKWALLLYTTYTFVKGNLYYFLKHSTPLWFN
ncbi:MAG: DUF2142 domain-containing protein [Oligoflexia bacterium]|nr:DUF2142 domain-containing protein [Oligoflexia bacterium]MBF0366750.1 DUF2142 domain-containing protein [Oligoflexia bacterium]